MKALHASRRPKAYGGWAVMPFLLLSLLSLPVAPINKDATSGMAHAADSAPDVDFGPYMADLEKRLKSEWAPPRGYESKRVVVVFSVLSDGSIRNCRVTISSGVTAADEAALRAVEKATPVRPLPAGAPQKVDIQFTFDYNVMSAASGTADKAGRTEGSAPWILLNNEGALALTQEKYQTAIEKLLRAIELKPGYTIARQNLALAYYKLGIQTQANPQDAIRYFSESLKYAPENAETKTLIEKLLKRIGDTGSNVSSAPIVALTPRPTAVTTAASSAATTTATAAPPATTVTTSTRQTATTGKIPTTPAPANSALTLTTRSAPGAPLSAGQSQTSSGQANDTPVRDKWALVIGISKFANPQYNLAAADKDATDFYNFLVNTEKFQPDHIKLLLNQQATRADIMSAFGSKWLPSLVEPGDLVVIYISTHGTPAEVDNGHKNYIVAYDTDANDLYPTGVDMDEIYERIKAGVKSDRVLIVLDTCFSGAGIPQSKGLVRCSNFDVSRVVLGKGHLVISSSDNNQKSWVRKNGDNSVFTKHLIEALKENNANVDVLSAFNKLKEDVQWEVKRDRGAEQTPVIGGDWNGRKLILSAPATRPRAMHD